MKSLHEWAVDAVGNFLHRIGFHSKCRNLSDLVVEALDVMSEYKEEGVLLFPEIVITSHLENLLAQIPFRLKVKIGDGPVIDLNLRKILKVSAPHCAEGWIIYVDIHDDDSFEYGIVNSEISELSQPIHSHVLSSDVDKEISFFYMRRIGTSLLSLESRDNAILHISSGLSKPALYDNNNVIHLAESCTIDVHDELRPTVLAYFQKILSETIRRGHGNLVGVVKSNEDAIKALSIALPDGKYLPVALDMFNPQGDPSVLARTADINQQSVRRIRSLYSSMMNQDGITVISSTARLVCFNLFIRQDESNNVSGGARTRAYEAMVNSNLFSACFFKSQDGTERFWKANHEQ